MTSKEQRIIRALNQRIDAIDMALNTPNIDFDRHLYLVGKLDGYTQAIELLTSSEESIAVELENC